MTSLLSILQRWWTWLWLGSDLETARRIAKERVRALGGEVQWPRGGSRGSGGTDRCDI